MALKILVTGSNGQLGSEIRKCIESSKSEIGKIPEEYHDCDLLALGSENLDITDVQAVKRFFSENWFDIIINCASMTNVEECEGNYTTAFKANVLGVRYLANECIKQGAKLIHLSTDYVFDGKGVRNSNKETMPYNEWDICNPINIYGKTKFMSENVVKEVCQKYFIIRTAWLYGNNGKNFVKTILRQASEKSELYVVNDQIGNPTNASDLAHHILKIALSEEYGVYHCTGMGECSWYDFACEIVKLANLNCIVSPCTSADYKSFAKRPAFSSLNKLMLSCTIGNEMRHWKDALKMFMENLHY